MKLYDCFQFFDEEMLLDLRLNIMDKYVDKFVITEATYMHNGKSKKLVFDINKFSKFKDKIIYIVVDKQPPDLHEIYEEDNDKEDTKGQKLILNGYKRDNYQREMAQKFLKNINDEDWIIINDIDEIPNLEKVNFTDNKNDLIFFKQQIYFYKHNMEYINVMNELFYRINERIVSSFICLNFSNRLLITVCCFTVHITVAFTAIYTFTTIQAGITIFILVAVWRERIRGRVLE